MVALRAPFDCSNPLSMASCIVEGRYPSLEPLTRREEGEAGGGGSGGGGGGGGGPHDDDGGGRNGGGGRAAAAGRREGRRVGPGSYCSPHHKMTLIPRNNGLSCVGRRGEIVQNVLRDVASNTARPSRRETKYSPALIGMVGRLLTTDPARRPSISEVAAVCAPYLMRSLDRLQGDNDRLQAGPYTRPLLSST